MSQPPTEDLGNGFRHHGVATPIGNHRGTVATIDGDGKNVVLLWLYDHRGCCALLMIDAEEGGAEEIPMPFPPGGDSPFASILSRRNRFYTHFNDHLCEFDPVERAFTFHHRTVTRVAMSMTEDDNGVIWAATYPNSAVASYNPETGGFRDYGNLYDQNWLQYPRAVAADDKGWIYFGIGSTAGQIIILNPETGEATPVVPEGERDKGHSPVIRDLNGKVYGQGVPGEDGAWYELYDGKAQKLVQAPELDPKPYIAESQGLFHREFPDGKRLVSCDLVERRLVVEDPKSGTSVELSFDYTSEGAHIMGVATAPGDTICGGTAFPMRAFSYDPKADTWVNREAYSQWNTVVTQGDRFFVGGYGHGVLLEWDPSSPWVKTEQDNQESNPRFHTQCHPAINRPHMLLAHPDGKTIVLAGTPGYGYTGGGLLIWDRETTSGTLLEHTDLIPEHSTMSLAALPGGKLLGGTTTSAGTGGEVKAEEAALYILDLASRKVEWQSVAFPGAQGYTDMVLGPNGVVFGFADRRRFFVFDHEQLDVVHDRDVEPDFGTTTSHQGPRVFVTAPEGEIYILFVKGIARLDPETYEITMVAESPVPIGLGGDVLDGRIYFGSGSHLYSYEL